MKTTRRVWLGLAALAVGCAEPQWDWRPRWRKWVEDKWTSTYETCWPGGFDGDYADRWAIKPAPDPLEDPACQEKLDQDIGLVPIDENDVSNWGTREDLRQGLLAILGTDLPDWEDIKVGKHAREFGPVPPDLVNDLESLEWYKGRSFETRQMLYNIVTSMPLETRIYYRDESPCPSFSACYNWNRTLIWNSGTGTDPTEASQVLFHEAVHGWIGVNHVECPNEWVEAGWVNEGNRRLCDEDWEGPFGYAAALIYLQRDVVEDSSLFDDHEDYRETVLYQIDHRLSVAGAFIISSPHPWDEEP